MGRPTSRPKSLVSLAISRLRECLGETQQEFAARLRITPVTVARYETSRPPRGAILERLYRLAAKHHPASAKVFRLALDTEKEQQQTRRRLGEILDPLNVRAASEMVLKVWEAQQQLKAVILMTSSEDGVDDHIVFAAEEAEEQLCKLADLICFDGRKELLGEKK